VVSRARAIGAPGVRRTLQVQYFFFGGFQGGRSLSKENVMRANYIIVAVLILLGLVVKTTSFTDLAAEAAARAKTKASVETSQVHRNMKLSGGQS
jgi:hypothetical protein